MNEEGSMDHVHFLFLEISVENIWVDLSYQTHPQFHASTSRSVEPKDRKLNRR
jgi:hypothetical protein